MYPPIQFPELSAAVLALLLVQAGARAQSDSPAGGAKSGDAWTLPIIADDHQRRWEAADTIVIATPIRSDALPPPAIEVPKAHRGNLFPTATAFYPLKVVKGQLEGEFRLEHFKRLGVREVVDRLYIMDFIEGSFRVQLEDATGRVITNASGSQTRYLLLMKATDRKNVFELTDGLHMSESVYLLLP